MFFHAAERWLLLFVVLTLPACGGRDQPKPAKQKGNAAERIMEEETRLLREATGLFTGIKDAGSA
jgi:hypothetical protein